MFRINFPSKDEITQVLVNNLVGPDKRIDDLRNQWFIKHLIIALREAIYMLMVMLKAVYDNLTAVNAKGRKLEEIGDECGVYKKDASKAVHSVTLRKSSAVSIDYLVPDNFLLTTTPAHNEAPVQFRVKANQGKKIYAGQSFVSDVLVECTEVGEVGNVMDGSINLVAQAGFDEVTNSKIVELGTEIEGEEVYRQRILAKKRNTQGGGTPGDYKIWAESVDGVVSANVFPRIRGNGTVDILINGENGMPSLELVKKTQTYIESKIPADLADGGVLVTGGTPITINITLSSCIWGNGYDLLTGKPIVERALKDYVNRQANKDRVVKFIDIITVAKAVRENENNDFVLTNFTPVTPVSDITLNNMETAVLEQILIS